MGGVKSCNLWVNLFFKEYVDAYNTIKTTYHGKNKINARDASPCGLFCYQCTDL